MRSAISFLLAAPLLLGASAQTWCGKHYMADLPPTPPGGQFLFPETSTDPLLAIRCAQAVKPYLASDAPNSAAVLVNAIVTNSHINGAKHFVPPKGKDRVLRVEVIAQATGSSEHIKLAHGKVELGTNKTSIPFSLKKLEPSTSPYTITCTAMVSGESFTDTSQLLYLPDPTDGTAVSKLDARTGAILRRSGKGGQSGDFAPIFPIGYYNGFDNYLAKDINALDELKKQGFNIVHPIPSFGNRTALLAILDRLAELDMFLMYDFRHTYQNETALREEVELVKDHPSLLLWYTADEPDGTSDPLNATSISRDLIMSMDGGGYHPVSLVLNCGDYYFNEYASGAEIIMQDAYTIGNNLSFSTEWGTPCTLEYGNCGCDSCFLGFEDISLRMDQFYERLYITGRELETTVWSVPQGFGNESYWKRFPTGDEWVLQSILAMNHGALGVVSWSDPTSVDVKAVSSRFALSLPQITPYILSSDPKRTFRGLETNRVDVGIWSGIKSLGRKSTLVLATNMNYDEVTLSWEELGVKVGGKGKVREVYGGNARVSEDGNGIILGQVGSAAFIVG